MRRPCRMLVVMFFRAAVLLGVFRQLRRDGKRYFAAMRSRTTAFVFRRPRVVHTMCCKMGFACTFGESVREESVWPVAMASRHFARRFLTERYGTAARVHTFLPRASTATARSLSDPSQGRQRQWQTAARRRTIDPLHAGRWQRRQRRQQHSGRVSSNRSSNGSDNT